MTGEVAAPGTMRAFVLSEYSSPDALALVEVATPTPPAGHLVIDVRAIGVNYPDLLLVKGSYQHRPPPPVVPGCEIAGVVVDAPADSGFGAGDRVAAFIWDGGFAERAVAPVDQVVRVPDTVDLAEAAAGLVNNHTAYFALVRRGRVAVGDTALVLGAAGGVGSAAVQVARGLGVRVIAGISRPEREPVARDAGADDVVVLEEGFAAAVNELTAGRGVDIVVDPVGDWLTQEALRAVAPEGRLMVVGFAAGDIPTIRANRLLLRNIGVEGVAFGAFLGKEPDLMRTQAAALDRMAATGDIKPVIDFTAPFEQLPTALHRLDRGEVAGKAVVLVDPV